MEANSKLLPIVDGFPRPDWGAIAKRIESQPESKWQDEWEYWSKAWLGGILEQLGGAYRISESENFLILSSEEDRYVELLGKFLERALRAITSQLGGIALDDGYGQHVILIFNEQDT